MLGNVIIMHFDISFANQYVVSCEIARNGTSNE